MVGCFARPVTSISTTKLNANTATVCASEDVFSRSRVGRVALEISAIDDVYIGDASVTSANGRPIAAGETVCIPTDTLSVGNIFVVGGACIITEYFG